MKKKIAIILSAVIFLSILTPCLSVININAQRKSAITFCEKITQLNKKYNSLESIDITDENGEPVYSQYENRLIVKTADKIASNAVESVTGTNYTILQYLSKEALNNDYEILKEKGYTIQKDNILYANSIDAYTLGDINPYNYTGANYVTKYFESTGKEYADLTVGIIDTGIYYHHEIYNDRYIENDVNFSDSGNENDVLDDNGHGTAVSSIVLMSTPDNVKVKGYKVLSSNGSCTTSAILSVLEYIIAEKNRPQVLNLSIGGYELCSNEQSILNETFARLNKVGTVVCAAAGNEDVPAEYNSIGGCDEVITVASHNDYGVFSDFSDYGKAVDITAPGEGIYAAVYNTVNDYTGTNMTGTSVACPFAAAACADILMLHPEYTPYEIKEALKKNAIKPSSDDEYYFGGGLLSFVNLLDNQNNYDINPDKLSGDYDGKQLTVSFNVPEGTELYYSLDAGKLSKTYTGPITINRNSVITYALAENGSFASKIKTQSYELNYTVQPSDISISLGVINDIKVSEEGINIIIPNGIGGKRPTSVYNGTFRGKRYAKVTLPDTITTLGTECFYECRLTEITAKGVTKFSGNSVFGRCINLRKADMPKLETVTESAFDGCYELISINFDKNITKLKTRMFANTSIIDIDMPKADYPVGSCTEVFKGAKIFTCNLPKIDTLNEEIFNGCNYLYKLNTKQITTIYPNALRSCTFIRQMDLSKLTTLYNGGIAGMWIEHLYAPNIKSIKESLTAKTTSLGGYFNHCETIEFPNLSGELGAKSLYYTSVKTIILPKITKIASDNSIYNAPALKIIYLPNADEYHSPKTAISTYDELLGYDVYTKLSRTELVFIPKATVAGSLSYRNIGTIYAPSLTNLSITITEPTSKGNLIFSDKLNDNGITVTCENNELLPNVIAPKGKSLEGSFAYKTASDWKYIKNENGTLVYNCNGGESRIPFEYIYEYWSVDMINRDTDMTPSLFFDFNSNGIINAKDFAIYNKLLLNLA